MRLFAQCFPVRGFLTALFVSLIHFSFGGQLIVCLVGGQVAHNGMPIRVGSELTYDDKLELEFSTADDLVVVVSPEKGRYMITARNRRLLTALSGYWFGRTLYLARH